MRLAFFKSLRMSAIVGTRSSAEVSRRLVVVSVAKHMAEEGFRANVAAWQRGQSYPRSIIVQRALRAGGRMIIFAALKNSVAHCCLLVLLACLSAGCRKSDKSGEVYVPRARGTITFNKEIAPIVFNNCAGCHRPGESAPFSLLGYEDVRKRAKLIVDVTQRRYMPPWLPDPNFVHFVG